MLNSILKEKANELDLSLMNFIINDINEKVDTLIISIERASEILEINGSFKKDEFIINILRQVKDVYIDNLYQEINDLTSN